MVAIPTAWQAYVAPGSFIFVGWDNHIIPDRRTERIGRRLLRSTGKVVNFPEPGQPAPTTGFINSVAQQQLHGGSVDISAVLGQFAPEVQVGRGSRIDYDQTEFGFKVYDGTQASAAFNASAKTQQDVLSDFYSTRDHRGLPVFLHYGRGYYVTGVFTVEKLHVKAVSGTQVAASLQSTRVGDCAPPKLESQFKRPAAQASPAGSDAEPPTNAPQSASGSAKNVSGASDPAGVNSTEPKTVLQSSTAVTPQFSVKVCKTKDTEYDLDITPGIPLGIKVLEVVFNGQQPRLDVTGPIQYFRQAMRYPD